MNFKIISFISLISNVAIANQCPNLSGNFTCIYADQSIYRLNISQSNTPNDETIYKFLYPEISNTAEPIYASDSGVPDGRGWVVYCRQNKMIAITMNGSKKQEYYIDAKGNYVSHAYGSQPPHCYPSNEVQLNLWSE
jgi:hypothetical protein